ncbi:haloacid dehalogenase, type II [Mucilaginibacter sp. PPCGB 2223]|uniref:haloacid dehalogenase type II n=1 Tax=Mucilaginibacter sp. PPCGB 2223 TaxID=1886027 RepID=UPI000825BEB5|nr:haloacid dehalogenase type II [Mucilaginibacter sp. PPCGB 2223]OCX54478.1 haloacid dehalogenase, type II [Mucilaginibacter sp. PPCGB 2223]
MDIGRSEFIGMAGTMLGASLLTRPLDILTTQKPSFKAIAFDGLAIFDPRPVFKMAQDMYPEHGTQLTDLWRTKQFEYTWLRNQLGAYTDFFTVTRDALVFATKTLKIDPDEQKKQQLMQAYLNLRAWPDVAGALKILKNAGIKLALLSNFTDVMMQKGIENSNLQGVFDQVLSTDKVKKFKPDPRAYQMAIDGFKLSKRDMLFVPFAGWDMAGGKQFGYTTFWLNRQGAVAEELAVKADAEGKGMGDLLAYCGLK